MGIAQRGGRGPIRGDTPPSAKWPLDSHAGVEFTGQYMGMEPIYSLTGPKTATVADFVPRSRMLASGARADEIGTITDIGQRMSALGGGADVLATWPESPLLAKSGHYDTVRCKPSAGSRATLSGLWLLRSNAPDSLLGVGPPIGVISLLRSLLMEIT
jgi:hypothetical protein